MQSCSSTACLRCLSPAQCFHGPPKSLFRFNNSLNSPHVHRSVCLAAGPVRQTTRLWCLAKAEKFKTSSLSKASKKTHDFHLLRVTAKKPLATVAAAQVDIFLIFFHVFFVPLWSLSASKPLKPAPSRSLIASEETPAWHRLSCHGDRYRLQPFWCSVHTKMWT